MLKFRGIITSISKGTTLNKKNQYQIKDKDVKVLSKIEGEYSNSITIDDEVVWQYDPSSFPAINRMDYTLPSDSTLRSDIIMLKEDQLEFGQTCKVTIEQAQRKDKALREKYGKNKK